VLDEKNGHAHVLHRADEAHNLAHFSGIEPGDSFVEQEQLWLSGQSTGHF